MNRREALILGAAGLAAHVLRPSAARPAEGPPATRLGICTESFVIRNRAERARAQAGASGAPGTAGPPQKADEQRVISDPLRFLRHCHALGAGGIQTGLGTRDDAYAAAFRRQAETLGMFVEGAADLPHKEGDVKRFDAEVRTAKQMGAAAIRVFTMPGRRYEQFSTAAQFRAAAAGATQSLQWAELIARRHGLRLAVENHKDFRCDEMLDLLKRVSSEYVGICVDTGNSIALLEDPLETVKAYAPRAFSVHLKDMAVGPHDQGFLLAEVPLGEGALDLGAIVRTLRQANPQVRFQLEMYTRDPLVVPCLTEKYWATLDGVGGRELARMLRWVRDHSGPHPLPHVSQLPLSDQLAREEENVRKCLAFAHQRLGL